MPDDARFDELWGMDNTGQSGGTTDADIDAVKAWDTLMGDPMIILLSVYVKKNPIFSKSLSRSIEGSDF
jgi:hypothetical protein